MTTACAIASAMVTILSASQYFGSTDVKKNDYSVLETSSGSCAIVVPSGVESVCDAFTNVRTRVWTMNVVGFVRDLGSPADTLDRVTNVFDNLLLALESDDTVGGTVDSVGTIRVMRNRNNFVNAGGAMWLPVELQVDLTELL